MGEDKCIENEPRGMKIDDACVQVMDGRNRKERRHEETYDSLLH